MPTTTWCASRTSSATATSSCTARDTPRAPPARCPQPDRRGRRAIPRAARGAGADASVAEAGAAIGEKLHELGATGDGGAGYQAGLVQLALLEARRADENRSARLGKAFHQLLAPWEALVTTVIGVALLAETHPLDAQEDKGLLSRGDGSIGDDEGHSGSVRVVLGTGQVHAELVGHGSILLALDQIDRMSLSH